MKMAGLFSGGKDSTFAVWKAVNRGDKIVSLLVLKPDNPDSYMFHHPNVQWTSLQAESMGFPLKLVQTKGEKELELRDLEKAIKAINGIEGVIAGALASEYQKTRVEMIANRLNLEVFSPGWGVDSEAYWNELLGAGFRVIITKVACEGLGKGWLGKEITSESLEKLKELSEKHRFHLAFEGGEAETFVLDCPLFHKAVEVKDSEISWDGETGTLNIREAILKQK